MAASKSIGHIEACEHKNINELKIHHQSQSLWVRTCYWLHGATWSHRETQVHIGRQVLEAIAYNFLNMSLILQAQVLFHKY